MLNSKLLLYFIDHVRPTITGKRIDDGAHPFVCEYQLRYEYTLEGTRYQTDGSKRLDLRDESPTVIDGRAMPPGSQWSEDRLRRARRDIVEVAEMRAGLRALKAIMEMTGWPLTREQQAEFTLVNCAAADMYWKNLQEDNTAGALWLTMSPESRAIQRQRLRLHLEDKLNITISDLAEFITSRCGRTMDGQVKAWREMETAMWIAREVDGNPRAFFFPAREKVA